MTEEDLNNLPILETKFGQEMKVINGRTFVFPVLEKSPALYQTEDDGAFRDRFGFWWITGWVDGKRYKRISPHGEHWLTEA